MRRTQAGQTEFLFDQPRTLAGTPCHRCGVMGVTIVAMGRNSNGAIEAAWCGHEHARLDGWPWLVGETPKLPRNPQPPAAAL